MAMELKVNSFAACCGIKIIHDFGYTSITSGRRSSPALKSIKKAIQDALDYGDSRYWYMGVRPLGKNTPNAMTLIALNSTQKKKLHKTLLDEGFKLVSQGYNRNHKNINYLYSLEEEKP